MTRVGVLAAVVALAASTIAPIGASGASRVRGFDGTTIKIAGLAIKSNFPKADVGTLARVKRFNDTNEIKGIKLEFAEYADSTQDPATVLSETRRLVTQDQVFAIVPDLAASNAGDYLNQQHVPYFGYGFDSTYCSRTPTTKLYGLSYTGCTIPDNPPYVADFFHGEYTLVTKKTGKKHPSIVLFSADNQSGKNALLRSATQAEGVGFKVVYAKAEVPIDATDYSPYVQKWLTANGGKMPDDIHCLAVVQCLPILDAVKAAGFKGTFWTGLYSDALVKALGGSISSGFYNFTPNKGLTQLQNDVNAVSPGTKLDSWNASAYFATDMFISALKKVAAKGKSNITPENVQKAAATSTWQIKGLVGPITYPASTVAPKPDCVAVVENVDGTAWTIAVPYTCSAKTFKINPKFRS